MNFQTLLTWGIIIFFVAYGLYEVWRKIIQPAYIQKLKGGSNGKTIIKNKHKKR